MSEMTKEFRGAVFKPVRPGLRYGSSPLAKRSTVTSTILDRWIVCLRTALSSMQVSHSHSWLVDIRDRVEALRSLGDFKRYQQFRHLARSASDKGHNTDTLAESLAHATFAANKALDLDPYDVQLLAVRALLCGQFVEMGTGEGKTLTMALAAAVSAFDGTPVHVLTASDYLAQRDAAWLTPFYTFLGLTVAFVLPDMSDAERRAAYRADVVHVTGKQVAFDWLRDGVAAKGSTNRLSAQLGNLTRSDSGASAKPYQPLLRGLCLAIVDEADSLLIDEARTPLVLAAPMADNTTEHEECVVALTLARLLHEGVDFEVSSGMRTVTLTSEGEDSLDTLATRVNGLWRASRYRDERVRNALTVLHCWFRDRDYVVNDNRIELVDPHTGRALQDRRLQQGLHGLLELKERCEVTPENDVVASLPFQHFFLNYVRLCGMSGTLREVRTELATVYGVNLVGVPPERPSQLIKHPTRVYSTTQAQQVALVEEVHGCLKQGRPVLIGTRTVEQSEAVSAVLEKNGISHQLLNAAQDANEAAVIAEAGIARQVTVATNMAGRGTDIHLGLGVSECGGLHVIALAFNDSCRLDRQLAGRAGRQGHPGTFIRLLSCEDLGLMDEVPKWLKGVLNSRSAAGQLLGNVAAAIYIRCVQLKIERKHAAERHRALNTGKQLAHHIAIGSNNKFTL